MFLLPVALHNLKKRGRKLDLRVSQGLIMTTVPAISRDSAAICRGLMGSFNRKKARNATKTGLQLNISADTEEPM